MKVVKWITPLLALYAGALSASVDISDVKARATFAMAKTGAAYFSLQNTHSEAVTLISVSVPESVAMSAEIHTVEMHNEMMQMRELENGIVLQAGETVTLAPGGKHIMLMGLAQPLTEGESFSLTLHFANGDQQTVDVPIVKM